MSKIRFENSQKPKKKASKGFYVALGICLIAIGATAFTTYNSIRDFMQPEEIIYSEPNISPEINSPVGNNVRGITEEASSESKKEDEVKSANTQKSEEPAKEELIVFPSSHNVIKGFSDTNPVYSKTFSDWRVHTGTDFKAEQGSIVKSMNSGVVIDTYNDPALGMTIVIEHDKGFVSYYSGLGDTILVKKDDKVSAGQDIGSINDIPCELSDESHLHLSVKKEGKFIDPMSILNNN